MNDMWQHSQSSGHESWRHADFNDTINVMSANFQCSFLFHGAPQPWWTAPAVSKSDCKEFGDSLLPEVDWIGFAKRDAKVRAFFDHQLGLNLAQYNMQEINISSSRLTNEELHLSIARHTLRVRKLSLNCLFGGPDIN